jgi:flagellar basal body rod protein FlgC
LFIAPIPAPSCWAWETLGRSADWAGPVGVNVDLAQQFSDLIISQRGYQASSQVISAANEMIQQLFEIKPRG